MVNVVYVVPWAICYTERMYIRKDNVEESILKKGTPVDDWVIKDIVPNPDKRSKDIYVVLDVYKGYDFKQASKTVSFVDLSNSITTLREYAYSQATDDEVSFLRQRILKLDKIEKKSNSKANGKSGKLNAKANSKTSKVSKTSSNATRTSSKKGLIEKRA